ncbi:MAG: bifunctional diaminohydroxyphosphoribosylaminopyrimidine deaminase/5-amino-6-(5-phosphoribosylamino)uracil reductase RibD [Pelovirga sp.]
MTSVATGQTIFMQRAIAMAQQGMGRTAPNPAVGAVVVRDGQIVGEGFHPAAGEPHAEIFALRQAGAAARGADLYVTLEPCCHYGRTPPCTRAIIAAGIRRVFIGTQDPNPRVSGAGILALREAGIETQVGLLQRQCDALIAGFTKHLQTRHPWTIYKAAMTLDGHTATAQGDSRWVSGEQSRLHVHRLRNRVEAIMVGIETALADDPRLTVRLPQVAGRDPLRVVVDSRLRLPPGCRMLCQQSSATTLVATVSTDQDKIRALEQAGAEVLILPAAAGQVCLPALWDELGRRNIQHLLLEGGSALATTALHAGLIDQLMIFIAPRLVGGVPQHGLFSGSGCAVMSETIPLTDVQYEQSGEDLLMTARVQSCLPA